MALPAYSGGNIRSYSIDGTMYFFEVRKHIGGYFLRQVQKGDTCLDCSDGQSFRDYAIADGNLQGYENTFKFTADAKALAIELPTQQQYENNLKENKMKITTGVQSVTALTLSDALEYVASLGNDWRLPNKAELESLYGNVLFTGDYYWTDDNDLYGEIEDIDSDFYGESKVWVMDSETGCMYYDHIENGFYVVPVKTI